MFKIGDKVKNKDNKNFSNGMNELTVAGTCEDGMVSFKEMDNLKHFKCLELVENKSVNMEKIKVSKEVALALDTALRVMDKEKFFEEHSNKFSWTLDIYLPLNQISNWEMAQILINGYEIEETPEEILLSRYKQNEINRKNAITNKVIYSEGYTLGYMIGVKDALATKNIKIKGIND